MVAAAAEAAAELFGLFAHGAPAAALAEVSGQSAGGAAEVPLNFHDAADTLLSNPPAIGQTRLVRKRKKRGFVGPPRPKSMPPRRRRRPTSILRTSSRHWTKYASPRLYAAYRRNQKLRFKRGTVLRRSRYAVGRKRVRNRVRAATRIQRFVRRRRSRRALRRRIAYRRSSRRARFTRARGFHLVPQTLKRTFITTVKFLLPGVTANRPLQSPFLEDGVPYAVVARQMFRVRPYILGPETGLPGMGEPGVINNIIEIPYCNDSSGGATGQDTTGANPRTYVWKCPAWDIHWTNTIGDNEVDVNERQVRYRNPMFFAMMRFYNKFIVSGAETTVKWDCRPSVMPLHNWTPMGAAASDASDPRYPAVPTTGDHQGAIDNVNDGYARMSDGPYGRTYADADLNDKTTGTNSVGLNATALQHPQTCPSDPSICAALNRRKERMQLTDITGAVQYAWNPETEADEKSIMAENLRGLRKREKFPTAYMRGKEMPVFDKDGKIVQLAKQRQAPVTVVKKYAPRDLHKVPKALPLLKDPQESYQGQYDDASSERTMENTVDPTKIRYAKNQCLQYHIRESANKDADTRTHSVSHLNPVMVTVKLKQHVFFWDRTKFSVDAHVSQEGGADAPLKPALPIIRSATVSSGPLYNITNAVFAKDLTNERMVVLNQAPPDAP